MKSTANTILSALLKNLFLAACLILLTSYQPYKRLWQVSDLEPFNEWFQINWQGQVVGWAQNRLTKHNGLFKVHQQEHFEGRVRGQRVKFVYEQTFYFETQPPYRIQKGESKLLEPNMVMETNFLNGDRLTVTQSRNQNTSKYERDSINFTLPQYLSWRRFIEKRPEQGDSLQSKSLDPHELILSSNSFTVSKVPQGRHQRFELLDSSGNRLQVNRQGRLLAERRGRGIELVASRNKPSFNPEMQTDLYTNVGLPINKPLGEIENIKSLHIALKGDNSWLGVHPSASIQGNTLITKQGAKYLANDRDSSTWSFDRTSEQVKALLPAIAIEQDPKETVQQLVQFVHNYLYYQPTPTNFTIEEIINNGYGDCTEYTQLLLALLNEQRIPAREVSGYIYLGDEEQRFGGHAWVEVLLDGEWVGVDPTWNLTQTTAGHLPITIPQEKSVSDLDFSVEQIHYK
ncbi:hypothetical protein GCM10023150_22330 [Kangiella taiwanensis]|uniref:Transglutaminase-like domain-containing protein n=1 Tax=Kangiella taiwanensis TaxID=1079179 RepID=A0ABP8I8V6_9GAMM